MVSNWLKKTIMRAAVAITGARSYAAAVVNRLTGDWTVTLQSADSEVRASARQLRSRSREQAKNNDYIKGFLRMCETNIVGASGFKLQAKLKRGDALDKANNSAIEEAFKEWSKKKYASVDAQSSFHQICRLIARTIPQDGEVFVRLVNAPNKFGFALQVIDADWFDEKYNEPKLPNGNRVVMSIEKDKWGKPVAYYATNPNTDPFEVTGLGEKPVRIPAEEIIHLYIQERPGQSRGVPMPHSAMLRLNHLSGYEEATVVGARVGASQMGIITQVQPENTYTGATETPKVIGEVQPGSIHTLAPGLDFKQFAPNQPTTDYGDFVKANLRGASTGLGVSYNGLANDLENVNYSSIRYGSLEERQVWMLYHRFLIEHFLCDVYEAWMKRALVNRQLSLPATLVEKALTAVNWQARGWQWVDPLKDMQANELALGMGATTLTRIAAEQGDDFEEILYERKQEVELIKSLELELNDGTKTTTNKPNPEENDGGNPNTGNKPKSGKLKGK